MSRQPPSHAFKLYLLGSCYLEDKKRPVLLPAGKVQSLLAYLALYPGEHTREKLAALFWGESTDVQARDSLRTILKKLRQHLDPGVLLADRTTIQLNPNFPLWVDALEFQKEVSRASEAVIALYRGDLLGDFYDDWIVPEREHLRDLFLNALLQLTQAARAASEYERAMQYAQRVLVSDPANERAYQHLMFCNLALGDRTAALRQYIACANALQTQLAVEPSRETIALYQWIQQAPSEHPSLAAQITNLPFPVSSFIGRKKELADLKQFLTTTRLLTLSGTGGSGKTRLAIQLATDLIDSFHDGVWWVDLAPRTDAGLVPQAVARVLGIREDAQTHGLQSETQADFFEPSAQPLIDSLVHFLRYKQVLLVLDNCEHLNAACAQLSHVLLTQCPNIQILATSREALGITGERLYQVPTLSVPASGQLLLTDWLIEYESIRLFVERAAAVRADFALTAQNAAAVLEICLRLDGIPLALELAAARCKVLSVEQIATRLHDRFNLLTHGSRAALPRHRTLRETIDWSYDLLNVTERLLFRRVSVFAGGFTLQAAQAVCAGAGIQPVQLLNALSLLVDKSLIIVDAPQVETRYRLLETIREYSREQLEASGEMGRLRRRHRDFFIALAEKAAPELKGEAQFEWLDRLEVEHDNWRVAWDCACETNAESALRLAPALLDFWLMRGNPSEGRELVDQVLERTKPWGQTVARAHALSVAGRLAHYQTDFAAARSLLEQAVAIMRVTGEKREIAFALFWLGRTVLGQRDDQSAELLIQEGFTLYQELQDEWGSEIAFQRLAELASHQGDNDQAKEFFTKALGKYREHGDRYMAGQVLNALGEVNRFEGDYVQAGIFYEQALEILKEPGGRFPAATPLYNLAWVSLHGRDYQKATALFLESLELYRAHGYKIGMVEECLGGLAAILGMTGKPEPAARLFGAVEALLERIGITKQMEILDEQEMEYYVAVVRAQIEPAAFERARAEGRKLTLERALDYALEKSRANL